MFSTTVMSGESAAPGDACPRSAATRLRDNINTMLIQRCDQLARSLANKHGKGTGPEARLLAQLTGAGPRPRSGSNRPRKKQKGASWSSLLLLERQSEEQQARERHPELKTCDQPECPFCGDPPPITPDRQRRRRGELSWAQQLRLERERDRAAEANDSDAKGGQ